MTEAPRFIKPVSFLAYETKESLAYIDGLNAAGINTVRLDPRLILLKVGDVRGGIYVVPIPKMLSPEEGLVKRVRRFGGTPFVLFGGDSNYFTAMCKALDAINAGPISNDVTPLINAIKRHSSQ